MHPLLPYGIMGTKALLASLLCMTLPETKGAPTAETMDSEEGVELGIQNVAMEEIQLKDDTERVKDEEKKKNENRQGDKKDEKEQGKDHEKMENEKDKDEEEREEVNGNMMSSRANLVDDNSTDTAF